MSSLGRAPSRCLQCRLAKSLRGGQEVGPVALATDATRLERVTCITFPSDYGRSRSSAFFFFSLSRIVRNGFMIHSDACQMSRPFYCSNMICDGNYTYAFHSRSHRSFEPEVNVTTHKRNLLARESHHRRAYRSPAAFCDQPHSESRYNISMYP